MRSQFEFKSSNLIIGAIILIGIFLFTSVVFSLIFRILTYLTPVLLIAALILDHKTVTGYVKWVIGLFKKETLWGVGATLLTIVGYPIVAGYLFGKAFLNYRYKKEVKAAEDAAEEKKIGEYIEFEDLPEEKVELPPLKEKKKQNTYDDFFDKD